MLIVHPGSEYDSLHFHLQRSHDLSYLIFIQKLIIYVTKIIFIILIFDVIYIFQHTYGGKPKKKKSEKNKNKKAEKR